MLTLVSLGCCGPLACGPAGCHGPVGVAAPACGGCGDCQGCGELYVDPWINEPPACSEPCDSCGNYNGQTCGSCRPIFSGIASLWGYRYNGGCGPHQATCDAGPAGCSSCSTPGGCDSHGQGSMFEGEQIIDGSQRVYDQPYAEPLPAPEPTPIEGETEAEQEEAMMESYIPTRDKQIFRQRGTVVRRSTKGTIRK